MAGMLAHTTDGMMRRTECYEDGSWRMCGQPAALPTMFATGAYPALDDPATIGCLWSMLVDAVEQSTEYSYPELEEHDVLVHRQRSRKPALATDGDSTGEAIARALLHVWGT